MNSETLGAWQPLLEKELTAPYFEALSARVDAARQETEVYPPAGREFFALEKTQPHAVRAVILGQDPYHEPGQAQGLSFYVPPCQAFALGSYLSYFKPFNYRQLFAFSTQCF